MNSNKLIEHKFLHSQFLFPTWEIHTLVLGTFNPKCGEITDYYYGRSKNNFWRTLEELHNFENMWFQDRLDRKMDFMTNHKFGCTDIIGSILKFESTDENEICGSGYSDQVLFTAKKCSINYQFDDIKHYLSTNNVKRIINTWGKRNTPRLFREQLFKFKEFCISNNIEYVENCPSPSGRFRSRKHRELLLDFYKNKLISKI